MSEKDLNAILPKSVGDKEDEYYSDEYYSDDEAEVVEQKQKKKSKPANVKVKLPPRGVQRETQGLTSRDVKTRGEKQNIKNNTSNIYEVGASNRPLSVKYGNNDFVDNRLIRKNEVEMPYEPYKEKKCGCNKKMSKCTKIIIGIFVTIICMFIVSYVSIKIYHAYYIIKHFNNPVEYAMSKSKEEIERDREEELRRLETNTKNADALFDKGNYKLRGGRRPKVEQNLQNDDNETVEQNLQNDDNENVVNYINNRPRDARGRFVKMQK